MFKNKKRNIQLLIAGVMVFILILSAISVFNNDDNFIRLLNWVNPERYQAVFLSNGQVYFGKVTDVNSQTLILEDIYYLKISQSLQTSSEGEEDTDNFSLIKLGNELHGPDDRMAVNLEHVLFVEDMKNDSKVVEAINQYNNK